MVTLADPELETVASNVIGVAKELAAHNMNPISTNKNAFFIEISPFSKQVKDPKSSENCNIRSIR